MSNNETKYLRNDTMTTIDTAVKAWYENSLKIKRSEDMHMPGAFDFLDKHNFRCTVYIEKVLYNDPVTVVFWSDKTKTVTKCENPDTYNPEYGLMMCIMKKLHPNNNFSKLFQSWVPESSLYYNEFRTLRDVRKFERANND